VNDIAFVWSPATTAAKKTVRGLYHVAGEVEDQTAADQTQKKQRPDNSHCLLHSAGE